MPSVFGNVFRLSGGDSVWANVFVLEEQSVQTRIGVLRGASLRKGTLAGTVATIGLLRGASKRIGSLEGTQPR
jgi:hypothetical protein